MKELSPYLECAMAVNTHGVKGALKLENRCFDSDQRNRRKKRQTYQPLPRLLQKPGA